MNDDRKRIDILDHEIMDKLEERFRIVKRIGEYKQKHQLPIHHPIREQEILQKACLYDYHEEIQAVYQTIFNSSRQLQACSYGLIGKSLPYTLSPMIYQAMGIDRYQIIETDHFRKTVEKIAYQGLNVTIPYKEEAYHFCDELDESSQKTKVVNTLIGKKGYNTDYMALMDIFTSKTITFHHEKIVIIGNGATARSMDAAIHEVAKRNLATNYSITHVVRSLKGPLDVLLDKVDSLKDATILINATSYGTSPNYENEPLFSIDSWEQLKWVLDVVYNPLNTPLLQKARKKGIPTINGFQLLVLQASRSAQLMMGKSVDGEALYHKLLPDIQNIVLIGMPYSGKSHLGRELKKTYNRPLYDFDEILKDRGQDLPTLLSQGASIDDFRTFEKALALELADIRGAILVPGGGIVLSPESMRVLKRNAIIVYLETPMATLIERIDGTRPLVKSSKDLEHLAQERITYYERYADFSVQEEEGVINKIYENCYH